MFGLHTLVAIDAGTYRIRLARLGRDGFQEDLNCLTLGPDGHPERRGAPKRSDARLVVAVGKSALACRGTRPRVEVVWPFQGGIVADHIGMQASLRYRLSQELGFGLSFFPPDILVACPAGVTEAARKSLLAVFQAAGPNHILTMDDLQAVGRGAGLTFDEPRWILQMGAGATTLGAVGGFSPLPARTLPLAGNWLDTAIRRELYSRLGYLLDPVLCREAKHAVGTLGPAPAQEAWHATGSGSQAESQVTLAPGDVRPALEKGLAPLVEELRWFLREVSPELVQRGKQDGILMAGGSANLPGLAGWLAERLDMPVQVVGRPEHAVIAGLADMMPAAGSLFRQQRRQQARAPLLGR